MPDRPPEFTDIDLDEEDDEEAPKPGPEPGPGSGPAEDGPIDFDEEDEDDIDGDDDLEDDAESDADEDAPESDSPQAAAPSAVPFDEDEEDDVRGGEHEGIARAAAVLKYIVENIVDEPDQISIGATEDDRGPVLLLRVAEDDRGKVIGRQGRIVQAIRTVVKAATVGTGERVSVEIID
jgi:predicted RNA-binding protein YlqC (UPF0109 family)